MSLHNLVALKLFPHPSYTHVSHLLPLFIISCLSVSRCLSLTIFSRSPSLLISSSSPHLRYCSCSMCFFFLSLSIFFLLYISFCFVSLSHHAFYFPPLVAFSSGSYILLSRFALFFISLLSMISLLSLSLSLSLVSFPFGRTGPDGKCYLG